MVIGRKARRLHYGADVHRLRPCVQSADVAQPDVLAKVLRSHALCHKAVAFQTTTTKGNSMSGETSDMELDLLQRRASAANCYCNRHRTWDPARGDGDLYLQPKKKFRGDLNGEICRYATSDQVHRHLARIEEEARHQRKVNEH
jgi:hypothetical protein